ncbi:TetR/AcrR family transcriptional regulator [Saccharomonospora iraqiensis]|uniref:TetR/AcrR family transcriptional regulator n=2 Tax=Saccharomonospora iraqiensis TaxID=52698 RepID=UPI00022DF105|nr:TetR/AcrR family transcriptional regulator [Saccharomonospora iraqiensis]
MGRPRRISADRLLEAAGAVIGRVGPGFTLAAVAEEAGVSVGSVAGRFGSRHGLLVALTEAGTAAVVTRMRETAAAAPDARTGVREALTAAFGGLDDPETAVNHLGQLGVDVADPALRELLGAHYRALEAEVAAVLGRDRAREWSAPEAAVAARVLVATANGTAFDWSVRPRGRLTDRLAHDLDLCLRSWWT